ncbi:hypothetical protein ATCC19606_14260 [Acinetobacter baumannii]|uniref:Uncharacterized protein n=1 Tax=Acinetobacter baumannii TaxID=470 RepID=A0A6F8TEK7_ACIBA|nr:hypothetical protein ATCC19606_14260 [Acinetobacter baumannii]
MGSTVGFSGEVTLPVDGDYIVQVYQMKKSAQRNRAVSFNLDLQILDNKNKMIIKDLYKSSNS